MILTNVCHVTTPIKYLSTLKITEKYSLTLFSEVWWWIQADAFLEGPCGFYISKSGKLPEFYHLSACIVVVALSTTFYGNKSFILSHNLPGITIPCQLPEVSLLHTNLRCNILFILSHF